MAKSKGKEPNQGKESSPPVSQERPRCGLVMPIADWDGCTASHWSDVKEILVEAADLAGFEAQIVSDADHVQVIHKSIVRNLYDHEMIVCDVSGRNPNVMFELGMRLTFDKPTVLVKDDATPFSFDTSLIEHLGYPRTLRSPSIKAFITQLSQKIKNTFAASQQPNFSMFLQQFGQFTTPEVKDKSGSFEDVIVATLNSIENRIERIESRPEALQPLINPGSPRVQHTWTRTPTTTTAGITTTSSSIYPPRYDETVQVVRENLEDFLSSKRIAISDLPSHLDSLRSFLVKRMVNPALLRPNALQMAVNDICSGML